MTAKLRALLKEATPGPWKREAFAGGSGAKFILAENDLLIADGTNRADNELIVEMRNSIEALLSVVEAAQAYAAECDDKNGEALDEVLAALEKM